jgi:HK97 family phage prohead protease
MSSNAIGVPIVQRHSNEMLDELGSITASRFEDNKLFITAELDKDDPLAQRAFKKIQKSRKMQFSIGASVTKLAKTFDKSVRMCVDQVRLNHVALTSSAANKNTNCFVASLAKAIETFEEKHMNPEEVITPEAPVVVIEPVIEKAGATLSAANKSALKDMHDSGNDDTKAKVRAMLGNDADDVLGVAPGSSTSESLIGVIDKSAIEAAVAAQFATAVPEIVKAIKIELAKSNFTPERPAPSIETSVSKALNAHPNDIGMLLRAITSK